MKSVKPFGGFSPPKANFTMTPNVLIENMHIISSLAEMKVIMYVLRHTWGFQEFDAPKKITVDEFMHGRKRVDGTRIDNGTGMTKPSIIAGLERAIEHGFLEVEIDNSDPARVKKFYRLRFSGVKKFYPPEQSGVKKFYPRGKEVLPRTEKETPERNPSKESDVGAIFHQIEQSVATLNPSIQNAIMTSIDDVGLEAVQDAVKITIERKGRFIVDYFYGVVRGKSKEVEAEAGYDDAKEMTDAVIRAWGLDPTNVTPAALKVYQDAGRQLHALTGFTPVMVKPLRAYLNNKGWSKPYSPAALAKYAPEFLAQQQTTTQPATEIPEPPPQRTLTPDDIADIRAARARMQKAREGEAS